MTVTKIMTICASAAVVAVLTSNSGWASDWTGKYTTKDMFGKPMSITLTDGGKAAGGRQGAEQKGTWSDEGHTAVISWDTGWTTTLGKDGSRYMKRFYLGSTNAEPTNSSSAEKVE